MLIFLGFMNIEQINLLINLKNHALIGKEILLVKYSISCLKLLSFCYLEGLIQSFKLSKNQFVVDLRFFFGVNPLKNLKVLIKKPYISALGYNVICKMRVDKTLYLFSTDKGLLNLTECKIKHTGGKIFFRC